MPYEVRAVVFIKNRICAQLEISSENQSVALTQRKVYTKKCPDNISHSLTVHNHIFLSAISLSYMRVYYYF